MDFFKFASERYSVRKYENKHLEQEIIDKILACGHVAPTGCNNQPQRILVLNTVESMEKLKKCTRSHFDAPTAMVIGYNKTESWVRKQDGAMSAPIDAIIVATHMMLMAHSLNVGTCMVMAFDPVAVRDTFKIPDDYEISLILIMGYPHKDAAPHPMHSSFRPLDEAVHYEGYDIS